MSHGHLDGLRLLDLVEFTNELVPKNLSILACLLAIIVDAFSPGSVVEHIIHIIFVVHEMFVLPFLLRHLKVDQLVLRHQESILLKHGFGLRCPDRSLMRVAVEI